MLYGSIYFQLATIFRLWTERRSKKIGKTIAYSKV